MWEHKPSVCVKLQLSSRRTAPKKSQVDLKGCLWGSFVSSFKFCPSPLFQQSDGVGGCSQLPDPGLGPVFLVDPSPCGSSSELPA